MAGSMTSVLGSPAPAVGLDGGPGPCAPTTTTVCPRQQQEQLRKTTIQTTIQHVAHLPVVHVDDATAAAAAANCVHLNSDLVTFLIPKEQLGKQTKNH